MGRAGPGSSARAQSIGQAAPDESGARRLRGSGEAVSCAAGLGLTCTGFEHGVTEGRDCAHRLDGGRLRRPVEQHRLGPSPRIQRLRAAGWPGLYRLVPV